MVRTATGGLGRSFRVAAVVALQLWALSSSPFARSAGALCCVCTGCTETFCQAAAFCGSSTCEGLPVNRACDDFVVSTQCPSPSSGACSGGNTSDCSLYCQNLGHGCTGGSCTSDDASCSGVSGCPDAGCPATSGACAVVSSPTPGALAPVLSPVALVALLVTLLVAGVVRVVRRSGGAR